MRVKGTVLVSFSVEVEAKDISTDSMTMYESDLLIAEAIDCKLPAGFYVESDIHVTETK